MLLQIVVEKNEIDRMAHYFALHCVQQSWLTPPLLIGGIVSLN
jgi:hypothetical protein